MATFIPDGILSKLRGCELKIANFLKHLPDDCLVYYEPAIRKRHPDFVVLMPDIGILVLEAKDWKLESITSADSQNVVIRGSRAKHPNRQARDYMLGVMDACRSSIFAKFLIVGSGNHAGRLLFPFAAAAVFSHITRDQFETRFPRVFPFPNNIAADELNALQKLAGNDLKSALKALFDPFWPIARMTSAGRRPSGNHPSRKPDK